MISYDGVRLLSINVEMIFCSWDITSSHQVVVIFWLDLDKCVKYGSVHFHNDFFRLMAHHLRIILQQIKKLLVLGGIFFQKFRTWHIFFPTSK